MELATIIVIALYTISAAPLIICVIYLIRLQILTGEILRITDEIYEKRMSSLFNKELYYECIANTPYPDVEATYNNLKWYTFWKRPSTLIVFEKGNTV